MSAQAHSGFIGSVLCNGIEIKGIVDRIELHESIGNERASGHIQCNIAVTDGVNFEGKLKGGEDIEFDIGGSGPDSQNRLKLKLVVSDKDTNVQHKTQARSYIIRGVSKTALAAHTKITEKGYQNQSSTDIITQDWKDNIEKIEGKKLVIVSGDNSTRKIDYTSLRETPFNMYQSLLREGASEKNPSSSYRMWETMNGGQTSQYNVQTEEGMKKEKSAFKYGVTPMTDHGIGNPNPREQLTIVSYNIDNNFSIPDQVVNGALSSRTNSTDPFTMQYTQESDKYGVGADFKRFAHAGSTNPYGDNVNNILGTSDAPTYESNIMSARHANKQSKFYQARRQTDRRDRHKQDIASVDQSNRGQTPTMKATFVVPGNMKLQAGKTIDVDLPQTGEEGGIDKQRSGKYLIQKLTHVWYKDVDEFKCHSKVECVKDALT